MSNMGNIKVINRPVVMGNLEFNRFAKYTASCLVCSRKLYFGDKWNERKYIFMCVECVKKVPETKHIRHNKQIKKKTGMSEEEVRIFESYIKDHVNEK